MNNRIVTSKKVDILAMEKNMREKLRYLPSKLTGMRVANIQGISLVDTGLPSDMFNTAFGGDITDETAREVFSYYQNNHEPMAWWIGPSSSSERTSKSLKDAGFVYDELDIGMVCDLTKVPGDHEPAKGLTIRRCKTPREYTDFGQVLTALSSPPDGQIERFYRKIGTISPKDREDLVLFIGYEGKTPVATSCLFVTSVAGIYDIATRPEKRRRGYGSAMFYQALMAAKKMGLRKGVLQASPDGLNIYKRFGFQETCRFTVWSNAIK